MFGLGLFGLLAGALESAIAAYAWRLNKVFGTHRVGWSLFSAFVFLALLHWLGAAESVGAASGTPELVSLLILILLLVGMAHTEVVLAERLRMERKQSVVGLQLQSQFDENTALKEAYESLRKQA